MRDFSLWGCNFIIQAENHRKIQGKFREKRIFYESIHEKLLSSFEISADWKNFFWNLLWVMRRGLQLKSLHSPREETRTNFLTRGGGKVFVKKSEILRHVILNYLLGERKFLLLSKLFHNFFWIFFILILQVIFWTLGMKKIDFKSIYCLFLLYVT